MSHTPDVEWAQVVEHLDRSAAISLQIDRQVATWLAAPAGARVADVGCGAGGMAVVLAEAIGADGHVLALDDEPALLAATAARCEQAGLGRRVNATRYDLAEGPPPADGLDLVWAAGVVHHLPDQQAAVDRLVSALTPRGRLALAEGGLPRRFLPWDVGVGAPGLEDRLGCAEADWFAAMRGDLFGGARTPHGWPSVLSAAGLVDLRSRSFLLDLPAPVEAEVRTHLVESLALRVERTADRLSADDRAAWERLLDPTGSDHLGHRDDVYLLGATTVHVGTRL